LRKELSGIVDEPPQIGKIKTDEIGFREGSATKLSRVLRPMKLGSLLDKPIDSDSIRIRPGFVPISSASPVLTIDRGSGGYGLDIAAERVDGIRDPGGNRLQRVPFTYVVVIVLFHLYGRRII
jgi:hypothetical protein